MTEIVTMTCSMFHQRRMMVAIAVRKHVAVAHTPVVVTNRKNSMLDTAIARHI